MRDLDPQLLRLREVESRICFGERQLAEQRALVRSLTSRGFNAVLAHELVANIEEALRILVERRDRLLAEMQSPDTFRPTPHPHR